ncbi:3 beta-hydroxysteroid dehydrogenase/Delta 5--_4-isomerase type 3-like [Glandiceps talaboti]
MGTENGDVLLVTGGAGFLGQHVVKVLLEMGENVAEVRTIDIREFHWFKGMQPINSTARLVHYCGDITKLEDVRKVTKDVDAVIHTCGYVDVSALPDLEKLKAINITGSENVLKACIDNNVTRLVYTSTQDVVLGYDPIEGADETSIGIPSKFLYEGYAGTKYEAEKLILKANNLILDNGQKLRTCSIRPTTIYGEGDVHLVPPLLKAAKQQGGVFLRIGNKDALFQATYVGNVAWAHVLAAQQLKKPAIQDDVAGQAYFICDDTELKNLSDFAEPFLQVKGYRLSRYYLPYWMMYFVAFFIEYLAWFLSPFVKLNVPMNREVLHYICTTIYFSYRGAKRYLGYSPAFSVEEAMERTVDYVSKLNI